MDDGQETYRRLGKRDLGAHAFEELMPRRIAATVASEDDSNATSGVITRLSKQLRSDPDVQTSHLCHEFTVQVYKIPGEGNHFCGYRNIQMLSLALGLSGACPDLTRKRSIPELQLSIQKAWDMGFNDHGRIQTGGIVGSRKHIGTSEAEALLLSLGVCCKGTAFNSRNAARDLLDFIEDYIAGQCHGCSNSGTHVTSSMPILLQRPHHSITVVGIERSRSGKRGLLVFDPAYRPPRSISKAEPRSTFVKQWTGKRAMSVYRRSEKSLNRYDCFETLTIGAEDRAIIKDAG